LYSPSLSMLVIQCWFDCNTLTYKEMPTYRKAMPRKEI
jgi:hypothetical protein